MRDFACTLLISTGPQLKCLAAIAGRELPMMVGACCDLSVSITWISCYERQSIEELFKLSSQLIKALQLTLERCSASKLIKALTWHCNSWLLIICWISVRLQLGCFKCKSHRERAITPRYSIATNSITAPKAIRLRTLLEYISSLDDSFRSLTSPWLQEWI